MINPKVLAGVFVVVVAAAAVIYMQRGNAPAPARAVAEAAAPAADPGGQILKFESGSRQLASIKVVAVETAPVPLSEPLPGRIAYNESVTTRLSVPIAGRVTSVRADAGDSVRAGAPLVVIDAPDLAAANADVQKARADENLKRKASDRASKLLEAGVIARKEAESAEADLAQAVAESARAQARLRNLVPRGGVTDSGYVLASPLAGVVTERQVNPGMEVRPDMQAPLFVVSDPTRLWVVVDVPERSLAKAVRGQPIAVEVDAYPDAVFRAVIDRIGETLDPSTRRVQVRAVVDNRDRRLKPEMFARATLLADEHKRAVRVPNSALIVEGLYTYVFVEREPGTFQKRRIELAVQDRQWAYMASGLSEGERIVSVGPLLLASELKSGKEKQ